MYEHCNYEKVAMLIRRPRGTSSPLTLAVVTLIGIGAGVYIWGPAVHNYLNTDPEVLAFREKSKLQRELNKEIESSK